MPPVPPTEEQSPSGAEPSPRIAGATDVGVVRRVNQDAYGRFDDASRGETLLIVADGLGGHRGGEVASRLAVDLVGEQISAGEEEPAVRLTRAIAFANDDILKRASKDRTLKGMGTTVVCLLIAESGRSYVAHVGDSRLYRLRGGRMEVMTEDHSLVAALVREGVLSPEEARSDPRRNQILRALGVRDDIEIEVAPVSLQPGDAYLLCSDGLHGMIEDEEIMRLASGGDDPQVAVDALIAAANAAGGTDNVTCLLARLPDPTQFPKLRAGATRLIESTRSLFGKNEPG